MSFQPRDLRHEIEDLFATLSGVAEISYTDSVDTESLRPLAEGRLTRSCQWIPPRRRTERERMSEDELRAKRRAWSRSAYAALSADARKAANAKREASRVKTPETEARRNELRRARRAELRVTSQSACA